jgi:hypothetical protein
MPTPRDEGWTFGQAFALMVAGCIAVLAVVLIGIAQGWW